MVVRLTGSRTKKKVVAALEIEVDTRVATTTFMRMVRFVVLISAVLASFA